MVSRLRFKPSNTQKLNASGFAPGKPLHRNQDLMVSPSRYGINPDGSETGRDHQLPTSDAVTCFLRAGETALPAATRTSRGHVESRAADTNSSPAVVLVAQAINKSRCVSGLSYSSRLGVIEP